MNAPLNRTRYGKSYDENYDKIFGGRAVSHQFTCEDCQLTFNATSTIDETPVNHPAYCEPGVDDDFSLCDDCSVKFEASWKIRYGASYPYFSPPFQIGDK